MGVPPVIIHFRLGFSMKALGLVGYHRHPSSPHEVSILPIASGFFPYRQRWHFTAMPEVGIIFCLLIYGALQERIMTRPYQGQASEVLQS